MKVSNTTSIIYQKLFSVQAELKPLVKDTENPFFKSKYADLGQVLEVLKPVLSSHKLLLIQTPFSDGSKVGVETTLVDIESQEFISFSMTAENSNTSNPAQGSGGIISYLRRYSLLPTFLMYAEDDDDGNSQNRVGFVRQECMNLIAELGGPKNENVVSLIKNIGNPKKIEDEPTMSKLLVALKELKKNKTSDEITEGETK